MSLEEEHAAALAAQSEDLEEFLNQLRGMINDNDLFSLEPLYERAKELMHELALLRYCDWRRKRATTSDTIESFKP